PLDRVGVSARTLDEVALIAEELAGHDEGDPDTRPRARIPFTATAAAEPPLPPMFAFVKTPIWDRTDEDTRAGFAELIVALGDRVEEVELFSSAAEAWSWQRAIMEAARDHGSREGGERGAGVRQGARHALRRLAPPDRTRARSPRGRLPARAFPYRAAERKLRGTLRAALRRDPNPRRARRGAARIG